MRQLERRWTTRAVAATLVPALILVGIPVSAAADVASIPEPPRVMVARHTPASAAPPAFPEFSLIPTDGEITRARVFGEPLLPLGNGSPVENVALAAAVTQWLQGHDPEAIQPLETFLAGHPTSAWRASLLANVGTVYERLGYFDRAEQKLTAAWTSASESHEPRAAAVAEQALVELLDLHMQFGRVDALQQVVDQVGSRELMGVGAERVEKAKSAIWALTHEHESALPSGPIALGQILNYVRPGEPRAPEIMAFHATPDGASIESIADLSRQVDFGMEPAFRPLGAEEIPIPSIVHLRPGHFAAIVGEANGRYKLDDPLLGGEVWISQAALREQSSGFFLVVEGERPAGWEGVARRSLAGIRGKCGAPDGLPVTACNGGSGCCDAGTGGTCNGAQGMAGYSFNPLHASIMLRDTPVGYAPPKGPDVRFGVQYHQRGATQPTTPTFTNMGSLWFPRWIAYIEDDPSNLLAPASLIGFGGGILKFNGFSGDRYAPEPFTRSELVRTSSDPIVYERRNTDGSREVYALADGAAAFPRRIFLTEFFDPQNQRLLLTYDSQLRLISMTDALGQVTSLAYEHPDDPLKLTKVTDPFGRAALFEYDDSLRLLRIVDVIGVASEFAYGGGAFVSALKTPYGTTSFTSGWAGDMGGHTLLQWAEATDPLGGKERIELVPYASSVPELPGAEPAAVVPAGSLPENFDLASWNSYHWDKRAMALHPGDRTKAHIMKWGFVEQFKYAQLLVSEKRPLENRVWYAYEGSPAIGWVGASRWPSRVSRVLDDGSTQSHRFEWTAKGKLQRYTDPLGRETLFEYGGGGVDLLSVKQRNGFTLDLLAALSHNGIHLPLTVEDASGQTTTLTYNTSGQPLTFTNAKSETTTLAYSTAGYLETITGPVAGSTVTLTWDALGRVRTVTYDSRTVTFTYDGMDRVIRIDYPDSTYEEVTYKLFEPETYRDRQGRVSRLFHDPLQRLVAFQDPQGRLVKQTWCECGDVEKLTDAAGNETKWIRDLQGRVTDQIRANGSSSSVTYETASSRVKKVTDAKAQDILYEYFLDDSLKRVSFANAANPPAPVSFTYDPAYPRVLTKTDGQGLTTYGYNPIAVPPALGAGQLASIDGPLTNDTITLGYDQLGRVVSRAINGVAESVVFDTLGRLQSVTNPLGTFDYTYVGTTERLQTLSYPNGQTTELSYFGASDDHRLQQILHKKPGGALLSRHAYTYEPSGNIKTWTQETDVTAAKVYDFEYDRADQLTSATLSTTDPTPAVVKRYVYAYDPAGNRTSEQIDNGVTSASHNNMNQTTSLQPGGMLRLAGTTNEAANVTIGGQPARILDGNRFEGETPVGSGTTSVPVVATDGSGNARTYTYDVSVSGTTRTLTYDPNGNLLSDGVRTYEWDALNQLTAINQGTHRSEFTYDSDGNRVRSVEKESSVVILDKRWLWHGARAAEVRDSTSGATTTRFAAHGVQVNGQALFYDQGHLGSIDGLVDAAGTVRARYDYDPYGRRTKLSGDVDSDVGYAGYLEHSPSDLKLTKHRVYDAGLGRWLSPDPLDFKDGNNLYAYVGGNPINRLDPLGLSWETFWDGVLTGLVTGLAIGIIVAAVPALATFFLVVGVGLLLGGLVSELIQMHYGTLCVDEADRFAGNAIGSLVGGYGGYRIGTTIIEGATLPTIPARVHSSKAPQQVPPGTRTLEGQYIDDVGNVEPWQAHYDAYGRLIGRTDLNAGDATQGIPDTHHHIYEYGPGYGPKGAETQSHVPGPCPPKR